VVLETQNRLYIFIYREMFAQNRIYTNAIYACLRVPMLCLVLGQEIKYLCFGKSRDSP